MKLKLTLEYDGSAFHGWARQPGLRTVEGMVRDALAASFPRWDALAVAGRTDTGVHATGQVASVAVEGGPAVGRRRRSSQLGAAGRRRRRRCRGGAGGLRRAPLRARALVPVSRAPRRARSPLEARRALWWKRPLDVDALREAAALLVGEHDFRAFTPTETQHDVFVRNVEAADWERRDERLELTITADSFLRHMVRTLVGTMLEAGRRAGANRAAPRRPATLGGRPHGAAVGPLPRTGSLLTAATIARWPAECASASSSSTSTAP